MRMLMYLLALIGGAAIVYRGLAQGLPGSPFTAHDWGTLTAFGFGALLALVGLLYIWRRLTGNDAAVGCGAGVLLLALSAALTAGAVAWRGRARGPSHECAAVLQHLEALAVDRDPSMPTRARFEEMRPMLLRRCEQMTSEQRSCPLMATTIEEVKRCP